MKGAEMQGQSLLTKRKNRKSALEALQAIYQDKKEQHDALIARLQDFVPILGAAVTDICNAAEDLTPPRFTLLKEKIASCESEVVRLLRCHL